MQHAAVEKALKTQCRVAADSRQTQLGTGELVNTEEHLVAKEPAFSLRRPKAK